MHVAYVFIRIRDLHFKIEERFQIRSKMSFKISTLYFNVQKAKGAVIIIMFAPPHYQILDTSMLQF